MLLHHQPRRPRRRAESGKRNVAESSGSSSRKRHFLPSEQPLPGDPNDGEPKAYQTPGDLLRPRWEQAPSPETILRLWKEGAEAAGGSAEHDANGTAKVKVRALDPGAYRLLYETKDDFGATSKDSLDFLVADKRAAAQLPLVLSAERTSVQVGGTARLLVHSGWTGQPLLFETFKGGEVWESRWIDSRADGGVLEVPVTEELRGGFGARLSTLKDHQFISQEAQVFVPWDNKLLDIAFSSFRDKLSPGGRETWRVTVKTPGGGPAVQGAAEILAYMYDRSLDLFAPHNPPRVANLYPWRAGTAALGRRTRHGSPGVFRGLRTYEHPLYPIFRPDYLLALGGYGIGGPGGRRYAAAKSVAGGVVGGVVPSPGPVQRKQGRSSDGGDGGPGRRERKKVRGRTRRGRGTGPDALQLRRDGFLAAPSPHRA